MTCDAIEIEKRPITIRGKPGRQIKTVRAENSEAKAARSRK
jgi:hypothetical protein